MNVIDVMSRDPISVAPDTSFRELWKMLFKSRLNALPVVNKQKKLLGLIAKENLLERLYPDYHEIFLEEIELTNFEDMEKKILELVDLKAKDVMNSKVIFTRAETPVMRALSRMIVQRVGQLPVLDGQNNLVGMVTKGDIFYSMFKTHLRTEKEAEDEKKEFIKKVRTRRKKKHTARRS